MSTRFGRLAPLLEAAREVRARTGKSLRVQAAEILALRRGPDTARLLAALHLAAGDPAAAWRQYAAVE